MFKYPVCSRCGDLIHGTYSVYNQTSDNSKIIIKILQFRGNPHRFDLLSKSICYKCYDFIPKKFFKINKPWKELLWFESDINIGMGAVGNPDTIEYLHFQEQNAALEKFNMEFQNFFDTVVVNNPNYDPELHRKVIEYDIQLKEERHKEYEEQRKRIEETKKKQAAQQAYDAKHPKPKCPTCGSTNIEKISTINRAVSVGMLGLASDKIGKQFQCKNCRYKW